MDAWKNAFEQELERARAARAGGNEGQARVYARRAAGMAIREYLQQQGHTGTPASAYELIQILLEREEISPQARQSAGRLLLRVDAAHRLPEGMDLIVEAARLAASLGLDAAHSVHS